MDTSSNRAAARRHANQGIMSSNIRDGLMLTLTNAVSRLCGYPVDLMHGDAKIFTIFEGTSEIRRVLIGRAVTGLDVR